MELSGAIDSVNINHFRIVCMGLKHEYISISLRFLIYQLGEVRISYNQRTSIIGMNEDQLKLLIKLCIFPIVGAPMID